MISPDVLEYLALFHRGDYHAAHDALEPRWIRTRDDTLHGLIQLAVGWHHLSRGNLHGARVLWRKALSRLEASPDAAEGLDIRALRHHLDEALAALPEGRRLQPGEPAPIRPPMIPTGGEIP